MDTPEQEQQSEPTPALVREPINLAATLAICSGGWLVPGLSHILLGKWIRGLIFASCVGAMFALGLAMHGRLFDVVFEEPLQTIGFIANVGVGLPYLVAGRMGLGIGAMSLPTYDYGTTYLWVAGLLNYLIVLDAFDVAKGRKP